MAIIRFACPECQSILKSGSPIVLGTKIKCPKCRHIFPLTQKDKAAALDEEPVSAGRAAAGRGAAADYAELDTGDEDDAYEDEYEEKPRPKLKKKKPKKGNNTALILGLTIGGVLLLVAGAAAGLFFWLRTPNYQEPLAFVPAKSTMLLSLDIESAIDQLGLTQNQLETVLKSGKNDPNFAKCKEETGLEFKELFNQVTIASTTPLQQMNAVQGGRVVQPKMVIVIKSKVPFDKEKVRKFLKVGDKTEKLGGKTYYKYNDSVTNEPVALFMPSKRLIVTTNLLDKDLEPILTADGNQTAPSADLMTIINVVRPSPLWMVLPYDASLNQNLNQALPNAGGAPGAPPVPGFDQQALQAAMSGAKAVGLWGGVENNQVTFNVGVQFGDAAGATKLTAELEKLWKGVKAMAGLLTLGMQSQPQYVKDAVKDLMNNTKISSQENMAKISTQVNMAAVKSGIQEMQNAAARMQMGNPGAGGIPGQPPGFVPPGGRPNVPPGGRPGGNRPGRPRN